MAELVERWRGQRQANRNFIARGESLLVEQLQLRRYEVELLVLVKG
jgi:hypothetical protein